jgi:hypothetical protein
METEYDRGYMAALSDIVRTLERYQEDITKMTKERGSSE